MKPKLTIEKIFSPIIKKENYHSNSDEFVIISLTVEEWQAMRDYLNSLPSEKESDIKGARRLWRRYEATLQREGKLIPRGGFPAFLKSLDKEEKSEINPYLLEGEELERTVNARKRGE